MTRDASREPGRDSDVRVRLDVAYDGAAFHGWAQQPGLRTVCGELGEGLARVLRLPGPPDLTVAGRTDAGVHAEGQVAHLDLPVAMWLALAGSTEPDHVAARTLRRRLAGVLAGDVVVRKVSRVPATFHARFGAVSRRYRYQVWDGPVPPPPLRRREVLWHRRELDVARMNEAVPALLGEHDFLAYCRPREGASTVRRLVGLRWERPGESGLLAATVEGSAFCHNQVRALVGAMLPVGDGRRTPTWPGEVLASRQRGLVTVAPAHALSLMEVTYP